MSFVLRQRSHVQNASPQVPDQTSFVDHFIMVKISLIFFFQYIVIVEIMYSFHSTVFCCSLNVHPDVRDIIAVGKTLECFRLATLKLKERCLVLKTFFL